MCQAEAWSQFFCNLQIAFSNYYASNTNPQSVSSYSLRVLKSLHEIFRAPFLIIGLKHCQSSSPAWRNSQQKHSRETCFLKTLPTTKNSSLQVTTVCGLPKQVQAQLGPSPTQEKHAPNSFLPLLRNYLTVSKLPSATNFTTPLLHTTTQGSRTSNKRVGKTTCTSQQNCKDNQRLSRSFFRSGLRPVASGRSLPKLPFWRFAVCPVGQLCSLWELQLFGWQPFTS